MKIFINHPDQIDSQLAYLGGKIRNMINPDSPVLEIEVKTSNQRTPPQNAALHLWLRNLATALNDAGYDIKAFPFKQGIELSWSEHTCKELIWRPVQEALTGKESTTEASKTEYGDVYVHLVRHLSNILPGFVPPEWPHNK